MSIELKQRTQKFALDCGRLCADIPNSREYNAYVHQLIKSLSSVGANYRAALRGKSSRDFINKLKIVEEEADESVLVRDVQFHFKRQSRNFAKIKQRSQRNCCYCCCFNKNS